MSTDSTRPRLQPRFRIGDTIVLPGSRLGEARVSGIRWNSIGSFYVYETVAENGFHTECVESDKLKLISRVEGGTDGQ